MTMALLPVNLDDEIEVTWQITNIDKEVLIISNPGLAEEKVHLRFDVSTARSVKENVPKIFSLFELNAEQRYWAAFWAGYFYAHLFQR
jgi:hypothetical protein